MGLKYNERNISKWTGKVNDMGKAMKKNTKMSYEIGELDQYLFGQGTHYEIYKKLGAHKAKKGKKEGIYLQYGRLMHRRYLSLVSLISGIEQPVR